MFRFPVFLAVAATFAPAQGLLQTASPDVRPDHTIVFRLRAPGAARVVLQFHGQLRTLSPMVRKEPDVWTATVGPVDPDLYEYNFIVDGVRIVDPQNANLRNGTAIDSSLVDVPGTPPRIDELRPVPHGAVSARTYYSTVLQRNRRVYIYTPALYDTKKRQRFPVLVLRHGAGDTEENWSGVGRAAVILDNLIAGGKAVPMILVMPSGDTGGADIHSVASADLLGRELMDEVLPMVERMCRAKKGRENRAIAGLANGGSQAVAIGLRRADDFA